MSDTERSNPWRHRRALIAVFVIALSLRGALPDHVAVEHFDEGVYASNLLFDESEGGAYPNQHLYAPPLVPAVIEWSITFLGPGSVGTLLPSIIFGALTVALAFHVAHRWFGAEAAWPVAIIGALSEFHIVFARSALTDVFLGFFCLLAVYLGTEAVRFGRVRTAVAAGVACGLAWCSKYNGWLPLAIVGTASVIWFAFHRRTALTVRAMISLVVMVVVAGAVFAPVVVALQDHGGYAAVAANHQRYVVGLSGWPRAAGQQFAAHRVLDGWVAWSSAGLATLTVLVWQMRTRSFTWNQSDDEFDITPGLIAKIILGAALLILLAAAGVGSSAVLFCCALGGLAGRLRWPAIPIDSQAGSDDTTIAQWTLPCWVALVWLGSLSVVTPMYLPYPRITIPWLIAVWLGAGAGVSWWVRSNLRWHGRKGTQRPIVRQRIAMFVLCVLSGYVAVRDADLVTAAWEPRTAMRDLARTIAEECIPEPGDTVVYTYAEPGLLYHLNNAGVLTRPVASLPQSAPPGTTVLLIEGPHARATTTYNWADVQRIYQRLATFEVTSSDMVLLDNHSATFLLATRERPAATFHVWRLRRQEPAE